MSPRRRAPVLTALLAAGGAALVALAACSDDPPPSQNTAPPEAPCGGACSARQICLEAESRCVCPPERTGPTCATCAAGYRAAGDDCEPITIDCEQTPGICGAHGSCVSGDDTTAAPATDTCSCAEGYAGRVCTECAPSHQDRDEDGLCEPTCATAALSCAAPKVCTDAEGRARCGCPAGAAGEQCDLCARGYVERAGVCEPTCAAGTLRCVAPQSCSDGPEGPACACPTGWTGAGCDSCAAGYAAAANGECRPTCAVLAASCGAHGHCVESGGFASCACDRGWGGAGCGACAVGYTGTACDSCEYSFFQATDGACLPTCASEGLQCPARSSCSEVSGTAPRCTCEAGYSGTACGSCASGFTFDGAFCLPQLAAPWALVSGATLDGREALVAIDPSNGATFTMRTMEVGHLAVDTARHVVYSAEWPNDQPMRVDLATGALVDFTSATGGNTVVGMAFDGTRQLIYFIDSNATLRALGADGAAITIVASSLGTDSRSAPITYDSTRGRILVATSSGQTTAIDPTTGAKTSVGRLVLPGTAPVLVALAYLGSSNALYALALPEGATSTIVEADPETLAVRRSFQVAARLVTANGWSGGVSTLAPWIP